MRSTAREFDRAASIATAIALLAWFVAVVLLWRTP